MRRLILLCAFVLAAGGAIADPATLQHADALIKAGQPAQALDALAPEAQAEDRDPLYHYLRGLALLDLGRTTDAITALRRALDLKPDLLQARAELGRAYVLHGDSPNAYLEFQQVRQGHPPPEVLAGMARFIDQAATQINPQRPVFGGLSATLGYDSNVNSGSPVTSIALPIFGGVTAQLPPSANPRHDGFGGVGGYVFAQKRVGQDLELIGSASLNARFGFQGTSRPFDVVDGAASAGFRVSPGIGQFSAEGVLDELSYGDILRRETGAQLDWRVLTGGPIELDFNYRMSNLDYDATNSGRDARRVTYGLALLPSFFGRRLQYAPTLLSGYGGWERPRRPGSENLGYEFWGVRGAWYQWIRGRTSAYVAAGYEHRAYEGPDPTFVSVRSDREGQVGGGVIQQLSATLSATASVQWIDSSSNIPVYGYRRTLGAVTLRKTF